MKKLLVLGVMLLSMLACSKSSSDTNNALNEPATDSTNEIVFVDNISSKTAMISKSISKGTLSDDYTLARDTFQATAGNGHGVYVKVDDIKGNITEFGVMTNDFVAVNKFNPTNDNKPFFAKVQGELNYFYDLQKNWIDDKYTESTKIGAGVITETVSLGTDGTGVIKYDSLGRVTDISSNFSGHELEIDGAIFYDATGGTTTYTKNGSGDYLGTIGNLTLTYSYDSSNRMTKLIITNSTVATVTINYTYLSNGYSMEVSSTGLTDEYNNYTREATYEMITIGGNSYVNSLVVKDDGTETIKVNYARNGSNGEINNITVKLGIKNNKTKIVEPIVGTLVRK